MMNVIVVVRVRIRTSIDSDDKKMLEIRHW